jgi:redox-sensitive bicupin YhaK (pirin superfamily)
MVGPFIFLDHTVRPTRAGEGSTPHHIGLSTVTYLQAKSSP